MMRMWLNRVSNSSPRRDSARSRDPRRVLHGFGRNAAEQIGLQDVIACERFAPGIQNREYAVCAIDACRRNHHHMAFVEQEVGETPALSGVEIPQSLMQVIANLDELSPPAATGYR